MLIMIVGLVFMVVGFAVPRGYDFDPNKPAREMEATENFYITLGYNLDICITVGMGFIALGGMIISTMMLQDAFCSKEDDDDASFTDYLNMANYSNYVGDVKLVTGDTFPVGDVYLMTGDIIPVGDIYLVTGDIFPVGDDYLVTGDIFPVGDIYLVTGDLFPVGDVYLVTGKTLRTDNGKEIRCNTCFVQRVRPQRLTKVNKWFDTRFVDRVSRNSPGDLGKEKRCGTRCVDGVRPQELTTVKKYVVIPSVSTG
ncbi:unnamed protein product [Mytilus coruscus]|uniref:Uncharacterized protein n=1 Tax=Mytilus coruscus TaxID=42192 RepID=A0A6J8CUN9_MYTCO|nr:unnamed protein product [Mytilus coruscus]